MEKDLIVIIVMHFLTVSLAIKSISLSSCKSLLYESGNDLSVIIIGIGNNEDWGIMH